jgi:hypothetical protein
VRPFNLEEALAGKPVVTRDGRKVTDIFCCKDRNIKYPVIARVVEIDLDDSIQDYTIDYTIDGHYWDDKEESSFDLFMAEEGLPKYEIHIIMTKHGPMCRIDKEGCGLVFLDKGDYLIKTIYGVDIPIDIHNEILHVAELMQKKK